jgi:hypothetical protein
MSVQNARRHAGVMTAPIVLAAVCVSGAAAKDAPPPIDLPGLLARVGERVEAYYARAQSILCVETVSLQPMDSNFGGGLHTRRLVYELRVSWEAATADTLPEANVLRQLMSIDGHPAKPNEEPGCLDPKPVSLDPLSFLLPHHQREYKFSYKGSGRAAGRAAAMISYAPAGSPPPEITWNDSCVSINIPTRTTGRLWVDTETGDVLRIDETVLGPYDIEVPMSERKKGANASLTLDRADSSIRFKPVPFTNPEETVLLPESIEMMSVIRGSGAPRLRIRQDFTGYQRFVTGARVVVP